MQRKLIFKKAFSILLSLMLLFPAVFTTAPAFAENMYPDYEEVLTKIDVGVDNIDNEDILILHEDDNDGGSVEETDISPAGDLFPVVPATLSIAALDAESETPKYAVETMYNADRHSMLFTVSIENNPGIWKGQVRFRVLSSTNGIRYDTNNPPIPAAASLSAFPEDKRTVSYTTANGLPYVFETADGQITDYNGELFTVEFFVQEGIENGKYTIDMDRPYMYTNPDASGSYTSLTTSTIPYYIGNEAEHIQIDSISFDSLGDPPAATIKTTSALQLTPTVLPENATQKSLNWTSSNTAVATVNTNGLVTPKVAGITTIRGEAKDGSGQFAECEITVITGVAQIDTHPVERIKFLRVGESSATTVTVYPTDAVNQAVTWHSTDEETAIVDTNGTVLAKTPGIVEITATTDEGNYSVSIIYYITNADPDTSAAKIGVIEYPTLTDAIKTAQSGDTITLLRDERVTSSITMPDGCSLNLGGYTLFLQNSSAININNGTTVPYIGNGSIFAANWTGFGAMVINGKLESLANCYLIASRTGIYVSQDNGIIDEIKECEFVNSKPYTSNLSSIGESYGGVSISILGKITAIRDCTFRHLCPAYIIGTGNYGIINIYNCDFIGGTENGAMHSYSGTGMGIRMYSGRAKYIDGRTVTNNNYLIPAAPGYAWSDTTDADGYYFIKEEDIKSSKLTITTTPASATVTLEDSGGNIQPQTQSDPTNGSFEYADLILGRTYDYTIEAAGYITKTGSITLAISDTLIPITLIKENENEDEENEINGGSFITAGGVYQLAENATGRVTITTKANVTIVGRGMNYKFSDLTIDVAQGGTLTIRDLWINNNFGQGTPVGESVNPGQNILIFKGSGNTLLFEGENLLENQEYVKGAGIYVPKGSSLTINGTGKLYFYKYSQGAGIGGNSYEASGALTFAGGDIFIKGSKTGPLVGGDSTVEKNDDIRITGGNLMLVNIARGAAIGSSSAGACAGNVYLEENANLTIVTDFDGSSIGHGGSAKFSPGNLFVSGGSFKAVRTNNSNRENNGLDTADDSLVTAQKLNGDGSKAVHRLIFDASDLTGNIVASSTSGFKYNGGFHQYVYRASTNTIENFVPSDNDKNLYFYLPMEEQILTVNGKSFMVDWDETTTSFTVSAVSSVTPCYNIIPELDSVYTISENEYGIKLMTVNLGNNGLRYFSAQVDPVQTHDGDETLVFTHIRDGVQRSLNSIRADFDIVHKGSAGFNITDGDVVKVFIVDQLTNDLNSNPIIYQ